MSKVSTIEVVGGEIIGEKAGMLKEHEGLIAEVCLQVPSTIVIASETVAAHKTPDSPNEATREGLVTASDRFSDIPAVVIRSSAEGDGAGNGIYESRFATNKPELVIEEAGFVIASFSTGSAQDFRRQAETGDSFALMVQPVIGQDLGSTEYWEHFGPYLSGFGYSSSAQHPDGYINVVAGIGGGVDRLGGQIMTPEEIESVAGDSIFFVDRAKEGSPLSFYEFLEAIHQLDMDDPRTSERNDFRSGDSIFPRELVSGESALAQYLQRKAGTEKYEIHPSGLLSARHPGILTDEVDEKGFPVWEHPDTDFLKATKKFIPSELLETMKKMEEIAGYPVYVEWALDSDTNPVILQIAPAEQTARNKKEANIQGKIVAEAKSLLGNGVKKSSKIVAVASPDDLDHLIEFNNDPDNEGYILIFGSTLSSNRSSRPLNYADCSKAGALIEIQAEEFLNRHAQGNIVDHLYGASRQTDKFIGEVTGAVGEVQSLWERVHEEGRQWRIEGLDESFYIAQFGRIQILDGEFEVYSDEASGRFVVTETSK